MSRLADYIKKRHFKKTPEPKGTVKKASKNRIFVIQQHLSKRPHFDFRIEIKGVLKSWALPKGIPKTTAIKRLAMLTDDHPLEYANFEGIIPKKEYGAGEVKIFDSGTYENIKKDKAGKKIPIEKSFINGKIEIYLYGKKIQGAYAIIKYKNDKTWLLIKMKKK